MVTNIQTEKAKFDVEFGLACKFNWDKKKKPTKLTTQLGVLWDPKDVSSIKFASDLHSHFKRKSQDFGRYEKNTDTSSLPERLARHLQKKGANSFNSEFSSFLNSTLPGKLKASNLDDSFVVVALQYSRCQTINGTVIPGTSSSYFVIAMIRDKNALTFDDKMRATPAFVINFSDLLQACQVDLMLFDQQYITKSKPNANDLAFIAQGNNVRDYFYQACGLDTIIKNKDSQSNLKDGLEDFFTKIGMKLKESDIAKDKLHHFFSAKAKDKKPVSINEISDAVDKCIPDRLKSEKGKVIEFLNNNFPVNSEVKFTGPVFEDWLWLDIKKGDIQFKARKSDVGKPGSGKPVTVAIRDTKAGKVADVKIDYSIDDPDLIEKLQKAVK